MKKSSHILFYFLILSLPILGNAQFSIGIKGNINDMGSPLVIKRDLLSKQLGKVLSPGFGIYFSYELNEKWAFQPEINYHEQARSFLLSGSERLINISILEYIRVPLLVKYTIPAQHFNVIGLVGPNPGVGIKLKSGETNHTFNYTDFQTLDFQEQDIKQFDLGLLLGIGIEKIIANRFKTKLSFRYNLGLIDIMESAESKFYSRGYSLDMGIMIPLYPIQKKEPEKQKPQFSSKQN